MKLDATDLRYITPDEFRVLTAVQFTFIVFPSRPDPYLNEIGGNGLEEPRSSPYCFNRTNIRSTQRWCEQNNGITCETQLGCKGTKFKV